MTVPVTVSDIKSVIPGLDPWLTKAALSPAAYNDDQITSLIPKWIRKFERETTFRINQVQVSANPDGLYAPVGAQTGISKAVGSTTTEVVIESPYPYYRDDGYEYLRVQLRERPVVNIQQLKLYLANSVVYIFPTAWLYWDIRSGLFSLIPYTGGSTVVNAAIAFATLEISFGYRSYLPFALAFDYVAGLPVGWQNTNEWSDIQRILSEYCALQVLNDISDVYDPGIEQKNIGSDGISQSMVYERFKRRKKELTDSINEFKASLMGQETPILFGMA